MVATPCIGSGFGKRAALVARAVWLKQSRRRLRGDSGKAQELTSDAVRGGWPWTAFYFLALNSTSIALRSWPNQLYSRTFVIWP